MMKVRKTAQELERMILARLRDEHLCPAGLEIEVRRVNGHWDAFASFGEASFGDEGDHAACVARITLFAAELRAKIDLAD
jgi:hypothetical protein